MAFTGPGERPRWHAGLATLAWLACWSAINAGPWHLRTTPGDLTDWLNWLRTLAPLALLALWPLLTTLRRAPVRRPTAAEWCWIAYTLLALLALVRMPDSLAQAYWGLAFLSVFVAVELSTAGSAPLTRAMAMNRLNWALTTLLLLLMLFFARDALLVRGEAGLTAHGLVNRANLGEIGPISRSTGMARLAIVPAVVGLVFALAGRGTARLWWAGLSLAAFLMIWLFQARQGIIGAVVASGLVIWLQGGRVRTLGMLLTLAAGALWFAGLLPEERLATLWTYAMRGDSLAELQSMTGRDLIWHVGWLAADQSPWLGYGPQADRVVLRANVSNGLLYAALAAGYPGAALYLGGLVWGWVLFVRAYLRGYAMTPDERLFLIQVGGIMAYLTLRHIPENTAALFSVDLLLYAPMLAWLGTLERVRGPAWRHQRAVGATPANTFRGER